MPSRRLYKHKKSYVQRPLGNSGKTFRFIYTQRSQYMFGGGAAEAYTSQDWQHCNSQYNTPCVPMIIPPVSLSRLIFETKYSDGYASDPFAQSLYQKSLVEAKYPDMFNYRYIAPVHYGLSVRVIRARTVIDSTSTANFTPTTADLQNAELSWQLPVHVYWRADYSNLNSFFQFLKPNSTDGTTIDYYKPPPTAASDQLIPAQSFHEMLVNRRFGKCTIQPGTDCTMSIGCNFKRMNYAGNFPDVFNTSLYTDELMGTGVSPDTSLAPVTCWIRKFFEISDIPGQRTVSSKGIIPGDLYMAPVLPETNPNYAQLYLVKTAEAKPKARLCFEVEMTTTLILRGSEWCPDTLKWGGKIPT